MLETSYFSSRFASDAVDPSYVSLQKSKLKIVGIFNNSTVNPQNMCVVVILTLITKPKWDHIHCDVNLTDNYFLCESKVSRSNATSYNRNKHQCHKLHTYHAGKCWFIQYNRSTRPQVRNSSTIYTSFFIVLSAWAYGHPSRNHIQIYINSVIPACISTNGLPNHYRKTWIGVQCNQNNVMVQSYALDHVHPATYTYKCIDIKHFSCMDDTCILSSYVCDGFYDCPDKSDEFSSICTESNLQDDGCGDFRFYCGTGRCIHATQLCDNWQDCDDGSDEVCCTHSDDGWIKDDLNTDAVKPYLIQVGPIRMKCCKPRCKVVLSIPYSCIFK